MSLTRDTKPANRDVAKLAFRFVLIVGIGNLFADLTYEGARSVAGPFLASLGASAAVVGLVAGFGEMAGYGLRSVTGYFADRTRAYWAFSLLGYAINMLAVPALALAGNWPVAAALMVTERTGRAVRRPAMESMLSHAGRRLGSGWVFGLNEALDQTGATIGPLITALVLFRHGGYRHAFGVLLISALMCLAVLVTASILYRRPSDFENGSEPLSSSTNLPKAYWRYVGAGTLIAAGFADFSLISFHFQKTGTVSQGLVPVFYSVAMATSACASLILGRLLDRIGLPVVLIAFGTSAFFAPLVFLHSVKLALAGMILWGVGLGAQDSCLKAVILPMIPSTRRSTGFGVFDTAFGIAWFLGSAAMGLMYSRSIPSLIVFSVVLQLLSLPVFALAGKKRG
jgi:predicted MFS family arabinose efflux permease